jgi:hypothetical protein
MSIGIIAGVASFLAHPLYIVAVLKRETVPHIITWVLSAFLAGISVFMYHEAGSQETVYVPLGDFIGLTVIALLALKYGRRGHFSRLDWACVVGGVVGIAIFLIARNPFLAFLATLTAEVLAIIPTMAKTYAFPREEDFLAWTFTIIGNTLNFLALSWANHTELIYVWTIFVADGIVWVLILRGMKLGFLMSARPLKSS